jgi:hypothetical protein
MAFTVTTYNSEDDLAVAVQATVTTYPSEDALDAGIAAAVNPTAVVVKGGLYYTLIDDAQVVNVSLRILAKGIKYTVILETV